MYLNIHSQYSLRYGTIQIEDLVKELRSNGIHQAVLTDINNSTGCMEFIRLCRKEGLAHEDADGKLAPPYQLKPIIGIEFRRENRFLYIGIAKNKEGMKELNDFLTNHQLDSLPLPDRPPVFKHAYVIFPFGTQIGLKENEYIGVRPSELNKLVGKITADLEKKLVVLQPITFVGKIGFRLQSISEGDSFKHGIGKIN